MNRYLLCFALVMCAEAQTNGVIAYSRAPDGAPPWPSQNICTIRADTSEDRCLTVDGHSHSPAWSPDGKRILFIHDAPLSTSRIYRETEETKAHHPVELSVMDADGRNRKVLRVIEPVIHSAAWSPDGRKLAFTVEHPRGRWRVHTANVNGRGEDAIGNPNVDNGSPVWSPKGHEIAFSQFTDQGRRQQIFVMNPDGSNVRQVTEDSAWTCGSVSWSPDGDHLVVSCRPASEICGMGVSSTGQRMPECDRRVFLVPNSSVPATLRKKLFDHDGANASFAPR